MMVHVKFRGLWVNIVSQQQNLFYFLTYLTHLIAQTKCPRLAEDPSSPDVLPKGNYARPLNLKVPNVCFVFCLVL